MESGIKLSSLSTWDNSKPHGLNANEWTSTGRTSLAKWGAVEYAEFSNGQGGLQDWPVDFWLNPCTREWVLCTKPDALTDVVEILDIDDPFYYR